MIPPLIHRAFLLTVFLIGITGLHAETSKKPNLVIFISDDHTATDSTPYGSTNIATPHMARIAAAGMTFDRAFAISPTCAPSRAAMLTGLTPVHNGAEPNHAAPRKDIKKMPAYLQELGYEVVAFGKVGHYNQTKDYGFDLVAHTNYHEDIAIPEALKWLENRNSDKPLCLFVGTNWPHVPWPKTPEGHDPKKVEVPANHVDTPLTHQARARYYAAITRMDDELGQVYDLSRKKFRDNLFFLHFADQGAQWPFGKWTLYDDGIRTPMIAVWPGHTTAGTRTNAMVCLTDVLPTLVDVAGGTPPEKIDGKSITGVLEGKTATHRDRIYATHSGDGNFNVYPTRCIRTDRWKYILNLHPEFKFTTHITKKGEAGSNYWASWVKAASRREDAATKVRRYQERPKEELYDLERDPLEQHNLADDPDQKERLATFHAEMEKWMNDQGDQRTVFGKPTLLEKE
ncbi:arylsulfatase A-like enzyme [Haloferula luteola]|uniref:Arylsulfatase A-like enzyme n=1 Tax=Haloferula luteola TaxID=595692 RepID=A0A840V2Z0_9BACT|nr:sulfatase [Haloferula luteola]MBB5351843.1 arylsulfatase A-like enzyme [Haloferula luteola]